MAHVIGGRRPDAYAAAFVCDIRRQGIHALIVPQKLWERRRFIEPPTFLVYVPHVNQNYILPVRSFPGFERFRSCLRFYYSLLQICDLR